MSDNSDVTAGIYCRISLAGMGDTTKTDDQERICRDLSARLGWPVIKTYTDHSQSAWKKNRKRDAWDEMLADIEAGRVSAVIVYHGDRLIRQPWDLEKLLSLADARGVRLASPTGVRSLDNADDRFILRIEAAQACRSSDDTSRRKKQGFERMRRKGLTRPGGPGGRCFGFEPDGVTQRPAEAEAVRRAAAAVLSGQSLGSIARQLAARGVTTTGGNPMTQTALRRILAYPRMAGLMPDGVSPAAWDPVLDRAAWEAVQVLLAGNRPLPNAGKGALSLLSGIARCDACKGPLWTGRSGSKANGYAGLTSYKCVAKGCGKVSRSREHLDAYVTGAVLRRLAHEANPPPRVPELPGLAAEFRALTQARTETAARVEDPSSAHLDLLLTRLERITSRLAELRAMAGESARERLMRAHAGISREEFESLPLATRRSLVAACFTVEVLPASQRGPGFRTEDVRLTRS